mgnify:CR=1 FL=1
MRARAEMTDSAVRRVPRAEIDRSVARRPGTPPEHALPRPGQMQLLPGGFKASHSKMTWDAGTLC